MKKRHWQASYGYIPREIDADRYATVNVLLELAMERFHAQPAFHGFWQTLTFSDVRQMSSDFAAYLQKVAGLKKGDRVAVMLPNVLAFPVAFIGIAQAGGVQVNVNPLYTARELQHQLEDSGAELIVIHEDALPTLAEVVHTTGIRRVVIVTAGDLHGLEPTDLPTDRRLGTTITLPAAIAEGAHLGFDPVDIRGEDLLFLQYTGGTTGPSKGAALTHRNLVANIEQFRAFMPEALRDGQEVVVTAIPLYHIFALMVNFLSYFMAGAQNWLVENPRRMDAFIDVLKTARPTVFTGVNTLYAGLAAHPRMHEIDWSRLRLSMGGGAAVLKPTSERWEALTGCYILEGYGLSETSPIVSANPLQMLRYTGTTGLPLPSTDVRLLDASGLDVEIGQPGEVCVRGPQVMRGYWRKPEANVAAFTGDGYFRTGDIGVFDDEGFLRIVDRKKDMVIVSGFNVYPNEVEAVAAEYPGVFECACVGVPDDRTGEAVMLMVVAAPGATPSVTPLLAHCRARLAAYKVPRRIRFVDALPKSAVGKILRRELRLLAGSGSESNAVAQA
ncbi:AMP-binding protein [Variovorax sp. ZS18.2.2]|uniref:AMP-binding protein n=1 Tax=Variovorax sp. ZS18.2.2 TaxID=2971255 RepID=UPI0021516917|nr:AMP-binding protein [Variovorax sp. ZS18.2.2]MCR6476122.1 AMP-binding protein [Variovorax sp. ZS18.2.2]